MSKRFNPFPKVSTAYGAQMGRRCTRAEVPEDADLCVAGPAYEYDSGGAYWGLPFGGYGPVWAVWVRGKGRDGVVYVRANSREGAKREARETGA
jgi:hypothetical protein